MLGWKRLTYFVTLLVISPAASSQLAAGNSNDWKNHKIHSVIEELREKFTPLLNEKDRKIVSDITFTLEENNTDLFDVRAEFEDGNPYIAFPTQLIMLVEFLIEQYAMVMATGIPHERLSEYMSEFNHRLNLNMRLSNRGKSILPYPQFQWYTGLNQSEFNAIKFDLNAFNQNRNQLEIGIYRFLFLHEVSHILKPDEHYLVREVRADNFALERLQEIGGTYSSEGGMPALLNSISYLQEEYSTNSSNPAYPSPVCRSLYLTESALSTAALKIKPEHNHDAELIMEAFEVIKLELTSKGCAPLESLLKGTPSIETQNQQESAGYVFLIRGKLPGTCNTISFDFYFDDQFIKKMSGLEEIEDKLVAISRSDLEQSTSKNFELRNLTGYCIDPYDQKNVKIAYSNQSCEGRLTVGDFLLHYIHVDDLDGDGKMNCGIY